MIKSSDHCNDCFCSASSPLIYIYVDLWPPSDGVIDKYRSQTVFRKYFMKKLKLELIGKILF